METVLVWGRIKEVNESGILLLQFNGLYKGFRLKKIFVYSDEKSDFCRYSECFFWLEILSLERDTMRARLLKDLTLKLF